MLLVTICWRKSMKINQFKPDPRLQTICVLFHSCSTTIQVTTCINLQTSLLLYPQSSPIFILHPPPRDHLWKARSPWALILLLHWHLHCGAMRVLKKQTSVTNGVIYHSTIQNHETNTNLEGPNRCMVPFNTSGSTLSETHLGYHHSRTPISKHLKSKNLQVALFRHLSKKSADSNLSWI